MKFNKIKLIAGLCLALGVSAFGQNNVGTLVTDPVRPFSVSSTHPSAIANEIKGGPFSSSNLAGLSNIPAPRLELGAIGYTTNTGLYYRLTATNPATWSPINGGNITNLTASNITGSIPFLNISNALTDANIAFGSATFNNAVQFPAGVLTNNAIRLSSGQGGFYLGSQLGFGVFLGVAMFSNNIARFQSNRVVFDQPIDFLSSTNPAALTTRTNLGIQDFVTNPVVQVVSGGTGATNAGGARTNLGLGATNDVVFQNITISDQTLTLSHGPEDDVFVRNDNGNLELGTEGNGTYIQISTDSLSTIFSVPINFNNTTNAATTRTNLGLGGTNNVVFNSLHAEQDATAGVYSLAIGQTNTGFRGIGGGPNDFVFTRNGTNLLGFASGGLQSFVSHSFSAPLVLNYGTGQTSVISFVGIDAATGAAISRTNLGLGWPALTNSNAGTSLVSVNTNGVVVSPTNFWQVAPIQTLVQDLTVVVTSQTNNATNARNLYVYSLATNVSGISNTILLPTNAATFAGDEVTVIHQGATNTTTVIRQDGSTNNLITLSRFDEAVKFIRESGQWDFYHNISYVEPIQFSGTNASNNIAVTRTNLGLGETNNVTFSALTLSSDLTLGSGDNIVLSTTNGTKIGTATNQLLGFYNQTPITQPSSTGVTTSGFTGGSGATVHPQSTFTGGIGTNAYTVSDIVAHLKSLGLIAP